jgi:L-malate glycosyltransferase
MKIGIMGPMDLKSINLGDIKVELPEVYSFPLISHLINGIMDHGHEVIAFTTSSRIENPQIIKGSNNLTICIGKTSKSPGRRLFKQEIDGLVELIKSYPPDIIHAHWTYEFAWAAIKSNLPHVVTIHDIASVILRDKFDPYRAIRWYMNRVTMNKAKHMIANSNYTFNMLNNSEKQKTRIINNFYPKGLDLIPFALNKENYIITVSNAFDKRKNIQASLKAFSIMRNQFPDLKYYLVGHVMNPGGEAYKYANENNLHHNVNFIGSKDYVEIIDLIKNAKIMVHPSKEESFGMTVLESMLVGTPVVGGSESGNIPYLLKHEETGLTCMITDPTEIAAAAVRLMNDENLYRKVQKNAKEYALKEFSDKTSVASHLELYTTILREEKKYSDVEKARKSLSH